IEELYNDRAPVSFRIAGSLIDLAVVAFASSPFAAIIELTNGNWSDWRVVASMGGIVLIVMFLYLTASTALAGRTWGMSCFSLRAVDANTGLPPTTRQSIGRAILYIASLITLGFGLLYALYDAEGRTLHDHLSGTALVRE
ncbi:MAG: RDD family protein, partial [Acidobacteria bacterium]|nr:RDD family protein [Acidobacteriota bacterium]